jgi:hypothetical protein
MWGAALCALALLAVHVPRIPPPGVEVFARSGSAARCCQVYMERLAEAGIEPSVGSMGDSYDNILAETIIGASRVYPVLTAI